MDKRFMRFKREINLNNVLKIVHTKADGEKTKVDL